MKERNLVPTVGGRRSMAAAAGLTGGVMAGSAAALTLASYVLRRLVTPERDRSDNVEILAVSLDETGDTVALGRTEELFEGLEEFRQHLGGRLTLTMLRGLGDPIEVHDVDRGAMLRAIRLVRESATGAEFARQAR